jgi:hypothetical protein
MAQMSPRVALILHRLYLTAFWLLLAVGLGVPAVIIPAQIHDHMVVKQDFACFDRGLDQLIKETPPAGTPGPPTGVRSDDDWMKNVGDYHLTNVPGQEGRYYSTRVWGLVTSKEYSGQQNAETDHGEYSLLALVPVTLLAVMRRWVRWLLKPAVEPAKG